MTKLEEKLKKLGYEEDIEDNLHYCKKIVFYWEYEINLFLTLDKSKVRLSILHNENRYIYNIENVKDLEKAFNEMQKDLEMLKKC